MKKDNSHLGIEETFKILNLFLLFTLYQFFLHIYFLFSAHDPRLLIPTIIAYIHDVFILALLAMFIYCLLNLSSSKIQSILYKVFLIIYLLVGSLLASYPNIFREYLAFPVNIFNSDISSAKVLISDYLGFTAFLPSFVALLLGIVFVVLARTIKLSKKIRILIIVIITLAFGFTIQRPSPQPFVFSLQQEIESLIKNELRLVPSLTRINTDSEAKVNLPTLKYSSNKITSYDHILLLVLEGVTSKEFEQEFLTISNGFYEEHKKISVYYSNYFASNLDSYTSLISMVSAIQVPYRAYADNQIYDRVNLAPNLIQDLKIRGFKTIFISTYEHQPFVPARKYLDKIYERKDLPTLEDWLSLGKSKMESSTEDKAAIPLIIDNLNSHQNVFLLHELVYGHSPEWRAKTGKSQLKYYNEYLSDLLDKLKEEKLYDKTLLIIVSDHGNRAKSAELDNYRIPLLVVGKKCSPALNNDLLSHLDVPEIVYHYSAADKHPIARESLYFVGSTEKWIYGKMITDRQYLFIDDSKGTVLSQEGSLIPQEVQIEFQTYLDRFNKQFSKY